MIAPVETQRMLVLSTSHLREATCNDWLPNRCPWGCYEKGEVGYFMWVVDDSAIYHDDAPATPNELRVILDYANRHKFDWIMFDRDGPIQPGLVVYDW